MADPTSTPQPFTIHDGLALYRLGAGAPILLMPWPHGASLVGDPTPDAIIAGLNRLGRQVITFDPPETGRSTRPKRMSIAEMLDCAEEALDICSPPAAGQRAGPVDVIGHSQGGFTALAFAVERPARVRRLVLVGAGAGFRAFMNAPGAIWNRSHPAFWRFGLLGALYRLLPTLAAQRHMLNLVKRVSFADPRHFTPNRVTLRDWLRPQTPRNDWGIAVRDVDYGPRLTEVRAPTLVLVGAHDPQMPPACAEELAAGIRGARLVTFAHSGHYPFIEEPAAFWDAVGDFLRAPPDPAQAPD